MVAGVASVHIVVVVVRDLDLYEVDMGVVDVWGLFVVSSYYEYYAYL